MRAPSLLAALALLVLAACDEAAPPDSPTPADLGLPPQLAQPESFGPAERTPAENAGLTAGDCRTVTRAYLAALERGSFTYAAEFWDDPVIDGARLSALFADYISPHIETRRVIEEEEAGPFRCLVTGTLTDSSLARIAPVMGEMVLRRTVDGTAAPGQQQQWKIESSTFLEPMQRSRKGAPD